MLQVIGAGFGRTGTHSLAAALDKLGLGPCYTILEIGHNAGHREIWNDALEGRPVDWMALYQGYHSAVEWPTVSFLPRLLPQFPEAKVILTVRDPDSWYESAAATIFPGLEASAQHPDPEIRARSGLIRRLILEQTFSGKYWDKSSAIQIYQDHIREVEKLVPSNRLLHYQAAEGWRSLCAFLEVAEPYEPFPRQNERASFLASAPEWSRKIMAEISENRKRKLNEEEGNG
jgi:hypothetical protein